MRIHIDDEELEMLIDFQNQMALDAEESGEHEEANNRRQRALDLLKLTKVQPKAKAPPFILVEYK